MCVGETPENGNRKDAQNLKGTGSESVVGVTKPAVVGYFSAH